MSVAFQASLLDLVDDVVVRPLVGKSRRPQRRELSDGAWVDHLPGWISGADLLFESLASCVPWRAEERPMYDKVVAVPRLLSFYDETDALPHPALNDIRRELNRRYEHELGEPLVTAGLCFYRDGRDSVAWHGDTIGRSSTEDTIVAIVSVGAPRALTLRPKTSIGNGGGSVLRYEVGHGDLLVMGGSCQRTWEHAVPKTAKPVGPRISIQFRPRGVR